MQVFLAQSHLTDALLPRGVGIAQLVEAGLPLRSYFTGNAHKLGIAYTTSVISLEVVVTTLIAARILQLRRWYDVASALRQNRVSAAAYTYTGAVAIIVESALPCTVFGLAYLVSFAINSDISILFLSIYVMFTVSVCLDLPPRAQ